MKTTTLLIAVAMSAPLLAQMDYVRQVKNKPSLDSREYDFTLLAGTQFTGLLQTPGTQTVTFSGSNRCPLGVSGANTNHYIVLSNGVVSNVALITGGTCTPAATGTLSFTTTGSLSGVVTMTSATGGIQEAVYAAGYGGGNITVPAATTSHAGIYVWGNNVNISGNGSTLTRITFNVSDGTNWITTNAGASGFRLQDIGLYGQVNGSNIPTQTTGYAYYGDNNTYLNFERIRIQNAPFGLYLKNQNISKIQEVTIRNLYPNTGRAVTITGNDTNSLTLDRVVVDTDNGDTNQPFSGIQVDSGAEIYLRNCLVMRTQYGLVLAPVTNTAGIALFVVSESTFDHNSVAGIAIVPSNGAVARVRFVNTWTASGQQGVIIRPTGSAVATDISFSQHQSVLNSSHGMVIAGGKNISITGSSISSNGKGGGVADSGIYITAGDQQPDGVLITGANKIGNTSYYGTLSTCDTNYDGETQKYGVLIDSSIASGSVMVTGNRFRCNTVAQINDLSATLNRVIKNNMGVDEQPPITVASASTINIGASDQSGYFITGTTALGTMTPVWNGREVELIFTNASPGGLTTGGNFATAVSATQNIPVRCTYRNSAFWYCK